MQEDDAMKKLVVATAVVVVRGLRTEHWPRPQTGMEQPGMTNGAKPNGAMDISGMNPAKGNMKREKDGAPGKKDHKKSRASTQLSEQGPPTEAALRFR